MAILTSYRFSSIRTLGLLFSLFLLWFSPAQADETAQPLQLYEEKIKAGLVYSFLKYTNWSTDALAKSGNNLRVCLLGNDEFDKDLLPLRGRTVQQYTIGVSHIGSPDEAGNCNMVFIHRNEENDLPELLKRVQGKYILTISDISQFNQRGGMVEFGTEDNHVGFSLNDKVLSSAGFSLQNRLLKLAKSDSGRND